MPKKKTEKRPKDPNQLGKFIVDALTSKHEKKTVSKKRTSKKA